MAAGGFQHPGRDVRSGGPQEEFWEDSQNGLTSLSGIGHPVGGGVRAADDRRRIIIPGKAASESEVFGVWGEYGVEVSVSL